MEKDIFNINKNQLSYGRGYVYSLQYHLVWCTKYRKKVLKDGLDLECKKMLRFHFEAWKQTAEEVGAPFDETIKISAGAGFIVALTGEIMGLEETEILQVA